MPKCKLQVPRVWKRLIRERFTESPDPTVEEWMLVEGKGRRVYDADARTGGNEDPDAYFGDSRTVSGEFDNGATIDLSLSSGQSNHYGSAIISDTDASTIYDGEDSAIDSFDCPMEFEGEDGETYVVEIEWTGDDPYEDEIADADTASPKPCDKSMYRCNLLGS